MFHHSLTSTLFVYSMLPDSHEAFADILDPAPLQIITHWQLSVSQHSQITVNWEWWRQQVYQPITCPTNPSGLCYVPWRRTEKVRTGTCRGRWGRGYLYPTGLGHKSWRRTGSRQIIPVGLCNMMWWQIWVKLLQPSKPGHKVVKASRAQATLSQQNRATYHNGQQGRDNSYPKVWISRSSDC